MKTFPSPPRLFPPITSDAVRAQYKKIFNDEYQEYLDLKGQVEVVHKEVTAFNDQMAAVKKGTEEAKVKMTHQEKTKKAIFHVFRC